MTFLRNWVKANPKKTGLLAALVAAGAAYYGVPPSALAPIGAFFGF